MSPVRTPADSAVRFLPERRTLPALREAAAVCTACPLHLTGARTVFGEGPAEAALMLVGEQPGDVEDREGRPFVGPAGRLLDRALAEAGIERDRAYVSNVVKHFNWVARGKRRMHAKPGSMEIRACLPWLEAELAAVEPRVLVLLGATAAQALLGRAFKVTEQRGRFQPSPLAPSVLATVHPSSLLRAPDEETRRRDYARFVADLRKAAEPLA